MPGDKIKVAVLGASGYTGSDLVRLAVRHPNIEIVALTANAHAGKPMRAVFPHLGHVDLPDLVKVDEADWSNVDAIFCGLPHGTTQDITKSLMWDSPDIKVIDMSADFRLRNVETYSKWYNISHRAPELQGNAVYGLSEHYRADIKSARLVACPGCYPTAVLMALIPIVAGELIDADDIVIDAKSGVSGAGRAAVSVLQLWREQPAGDSNVMGCMLATRGCVSCRVVAGQPRAWADGAAEAPGRGGRDRDRDRGAEPVPARSRRRGRA